jgi:preprotein translocase SecE subunit
MADTQPAKPKRLVKNPETFRERAIKATQVSDKPSRAGRLKTAIGKILSPIFHPIGTVLRRFFGLKPMRILGKVIFPPYLRNSWAELKLVTWPNWKQSRRLTSAVLIFAIIFGAVIALVDYGLDKVFRNILLK